MPENTPPDTAPTPTQEAPNTQQELLLTQETKPAPATQKAAKPAAEAPKASDEGEGLLTSGTTQDDGKGKPEGTPTPPAPLDLKPPVGVDPNDAGFVKFKQFATQKKLTQEQAQEALNMYAASLEDAASKARTAFANTVMEWTKQAKSDPEFGQERLASSLSMAKGALDRFGTNGLKQVLDQSGLSNHPEVIRFFTRVGKILLKEDSFLHSGLRSQPPQTKNDPDEALRRAYPSMFPKDKEQ
jgi:hypothetical protein